ncbi:MAG TPA: CmpA/NrtA family ABC transporter substrate-binding protein [Chthoniobacterales bacterium]
MPNPRTTSARPSAPVPTNGAPVLRIGYVPLVDCAPIIAAQELGIFSKHGLNVVLSREVGWATIKEKIFYGEIDAAHAPAGMAFAMKLGIQCRPCDVQTSFILSLNGNAITLSSTLWKKGVTDAGSLLQLIRGHREERLVLGVVSRVSSHHFLMRHWLQQAGIDPDRDVRIVVIPPAQMFPTLRAGLLDGYCVGEPYNSRAILEGAGWCPATSLDLAPQHPEKAFIVRADFPERRLEEYLAAIRALHEAAQFCDDPAHREELIAMLERTALPGTAVYMRNSLIGPFQHGCGITKALPDFHRFYRDDTNRPDLGKAAWTLDHLQSADIFKPSEANLHDLAGTVFREEYFDLALAS